MIDVSGAIAATKVIAGVVKDAGRIDLTQQVIDLQSTLLELVAKNGDLVGQVAELQATVRQLRNELEQEEAFAFDHECYWRVANQPPDGPFCSRCLDVDRKAVRMHKRGNGDFAWCPQCERSVRWVPGPLSPTAPRVRLNWVHGWRG